MPLTLAGLGLFDEKDLSLRTIEQARKADKVYIELYTSKWHGNLQNLRKLISKEIVELKRRDLEENSNQILEEARSQNVVIFVQGDPLVQTTHLALLQEAKNLGIQTKVVHNASIISAVGETGLHLQKFGQYVTIPFPEKTKGKPPESVLKTIKENRKRDLHTLCLLDVIAEENRYMNVNEALEILLENRVVDKNTEIVVFSKAGSENPSILYGKVDHVQKKDIKGLPTVVIILGKLHFTESEYLELYV